MRVLLAFTILFLNFGAQAQQWRQGNYHHPWSDGILDTMSLRDQIAQMMMVGAYSNKGPEHTEEIENLIHNYHIGGLCFFQGTALPQAYLTNYYQQNSPIPLLMAIDGEWGLAMRLKNLSKFPYQMTLGAAGSKEFAYQTGYEMGKQCKRIGIHVNFAPDVDVNTNPDNPIIGFRSFGENPNDVEEYGIEIMRGMQDAGIIACAKHFPGHGDSRTDSHNELPLILHDRQRLEDVEMHPFKKLYEEGVMSTMIAHLEIPVLDSARHRPSSLSKPIVTDILKKELKFRGLIFTDALNMTGVTKYYGNGYAEAAAVIAGNDILLIPENVPKAIEVILEEVRSGNIDSIEITEHVRKILYFKMLAGLNNYKHVETRNLVNELQSPTIAEINRNVAELAITVVEDNNQLLPLPVNTTERTAVWTIGKSGNYILGAAIQQYQKADVFFTHRDSGYEVFNLMADSLIRHYDKVIISIHEWNLWGKKSQYIPQPIVQNIYKIAAEKPTVVAIFGNIYLLKNLPKLNCVVMGYEDSDPFQLAAVDIIFGEKASKGKLPAMAASGYYANQGINTQTRLNQRFETANPKDAGFKTDFSEPLNQLLIQTRDMGAAPGGQLLVLKNGKAVYNNAWGYYDYSEAHAIKYNTIYDVASITKAASTTMAVMKLMELGLLRLEAPLYSYLPDLRGTKLEKMTLKSLLLHESGLPPFIPFYKEAIKRNNVFADTLTMAEDVQVSEKLWMQISEAHRIWDEIKKCPLEKVGSYKYSDLNMILVQRVVESVVGQSIDVYVDREFYKPMHLQRTMFIPYTKYPIQEMAPTAIDNYFRNDTIQGFVHDPTAAMMGGVAGHAGLFSNATELGVLFQMLLNKGIWDEKQYLRASTIKEFTKAAHRKTHRGLGFDKPNGLKGEKANISEMVSLNLFGHTGFTGNWAWADPDNNLVFVFLSNRTYPDENNKKLIQNNIRTQAIEIVYGALK